VEEKLAGLPQTAKGVKVEDWLLWLIDSYRLKAAAMPSPQHTQRYAMA
jgi:hypothetical protein